MPNDYFHYFDFGLSSWADSVLARTRAHVVQIFLDAFSPALADKVLDVGVSENSHPSSNYLERVYPHPASITALSVLPFPSLRADFPAVTLICADARALPFRDSAFDFVYSHAVIEHTGSRANQARFIAEALRVCRKGILITTPNRWHPVETHIGLPLIHYLPARVFRWLCKALGKDMYAQEETLNLLSARHLQKLLQTLGVPADRIEPHRIHWLGLPSNLVFVVRKTSVPAVPPA